MTKRDQLHIDLGIAYACCFLLRGAAVAKRVKEISAYAREKEASQVPVKIKSPRRKVRKA